MNTTAVVDVDVERPYQVRIGRNLGPEVASFAQGRTRVALLHPPTLRALGAALVAHLDADVTVVELPDAEAAKTNATLVACWEALAAAGFTRSDLVIGLGGGATTDLAGFVAATWLRGVDFLSVPTTLLGMVDAAVGGKTGINLAAGKNLVGSFHQPLAVSCDLNLLATLPPADLHAGMAEIVKAGFIADPEILQLIETDPAGALDCRSDVLAELVTRAIRVKATVVSADPRENTSQDRSVGRELLNYGHTLGHAIERAENYNWRHGEAISVGMVWAARVAEGLGLLAGDIVARHRCLLRGLGLPTSYPAERYDDLRAAMDLDKKTRGRTLRLVLLEDVAKALVVADPDEDVLRAAFCTLAD